MGGGLPSQRKGRRLVPYQKKMLSVALPAEPRGEKKTFFCANFGCEKLLKFGEKWAVKKF